MTPFLQHPTKGGVMWKLIALAVAVGIFAAPAIAAERIHVKGTDTGTFSLTPTSDPDVVLAVDVGSGFASHLGKYDFVAHETFNTRLFAITQDSFTITTRHGTLYGSYTATLGHGNPPEAIITYHAPGSITGGTGRYAGATGTIVFDGWGDLRTSAYQQHFTAAIVLPDEEEGGDD
jgi:hypothetical protein